GENGTIDGQGDAWWNMWRNRTLQFTRPNLVEFVNSKDIIISNVIFKDSPFWNIHPVYCSNVVVRFATILAPRDSPNTDGIDPDSSSNVCIEDSYISTGDDLVAVKSGWDEYGIAYGRPSSNITIRRVTGSSPFAGIAIGSEASGGVENILAEHINLNNMGIGDVGDHADDKYDHNALPIVKGITIVNVWGVKVLQAGLIKGIKNSPFSDICLSDINLHGVNGTRSRTPSWMCSDVVGVAHEVSPWPCSELISQKLGSCVNY
ncbi:putative polygalacturonase-like protein, partial [Trifolium pratense]